MTHNSPCGLDSTGSKETMTDQVLPMVPSSASRKEVPREKLCGLDQYHIQITLEEK